MPESKPKSNEKARRMVREEVESAIAPLLKRIAVLENALSGDKAKEKPVKPVAVIGADDIAKLRKKWDLSRKTFGELFGVSDEEVKDWERGKSVPVLKTAEQIVQIRAMSKKERNTLVKSLSPEPAKETKETNVVAPVQK